MVRRRVRGRRRARELDAGFTIPELMVSLTLLAVVLTAVAGLFMSGLRTAGTTNRRTEAAGLAVKHTEALRTLTYAGVGHYGDLKPAGATFDSLPYVSIGTNAPAALVATCASLTNTSPQCPNSRETIRGGTYDIARHVTWADADDGAATYDDAYKRTTVIVSWIDQNGPHSVREDSILYPGGLGSYTGPGNSGTTTTIPTSPPNAPVDLDANTAPGVEGETSVDVTWQAGAPGTAVAYHVVKWSTNPALAQDVFASPQLSGSTVSYRVSGLASSATYFFQVFAYSSAGHESAGSNIDDATTAASSTCTVSSLSVAGNSTTKTYLRSDGRLSEDLDATLTLTSSTCTQSFSLRGTDPNPAPTPGSPYAFPASGTTRTVEVGGNNDTGWTTGTHTFTLMVNGVVPNNPVTKTFLFCAYKNNPDRSPLPSTC